MATILNSWSNLTHVTKNHDRRNLLRSSIFNAYAKFPGVNMTKSKRSYRSFAV